MHTTIYAIAESPKNRNVIWVGTDDGNLQVTRDGGKTWTNVVANIPGLPKSAWVSCVERGTLRRGHGVRDLRPAHVRRHEAVRVQDDRLRQDLDAGHRARGTPVRGYAHVIKEDLVQSRPPLRRAPSSDCGSRSTAASSGRSTRAAICRTSRCAIWPSIRATTISSSPRTAAASGSSTTSRRCARSTPRCCRRTPCSCRRSPPCSTISARRRLGRTATRSSSATTRPTTPSSLTTKDAATSSAT